MIGSVFSPYYAWSGRHTPTNHHALNVGLYGKGGKRWTMTERKTAALKQSPHFLQMGPSSLSWENGTLTIDITEWANPVPRRVLGTIKITPKAINTQSFELHSNGKHFWQPIAPKADVSVEFSNPKMAWEGTAYLDSNWGAEPLEAGFKYWDWSRTHLNNGTGILYDAYTRDGENRKLNLLISDDGKIYHKPDLPRKTLNKGPIWRVDRYIHCDKSTQPKVLSTLEDTPFYTRSKVSSSFYGEEALTIHESLDCDRFASNWVRCLLPFRMPRV